MTSGKGATIHLHKNPLPVSRICTLPTVMNGRLHYLWCAWMRASPTWHLHEIVHGRDGLLGLERCRIAEIVEMRR